MPEWGKPVTMVNSRLSLGWGDSRSPHCSGRGCDKVIHYLSRPFLAGGSKNDHHFTLEREIRALREKAFGVFKNDFLYDFSGVMPFFHL